MSLLTRLFRRRPRPGGGFIAYYGLTAWWESAFTPEERALIVRTWRPERPDGHLVEGVIAHSEVTAVTFLTRMASWFEDVDASIERRIISKAASLLTERPELEVMHVTYHHQIRSLSEKRDDPQCYASLIIACRRQIAIADCMARASHKNRPGSRLPQHLGYEVLIAIREREDKLDEALRLARTAQRQGWPGDWASWIARLERKQFERRLTAS